jgi:hypothetical protein
MGLKLWSPAGVSSGAPGDTRLAWGSLKKRLGTLSFAGFHAARRAIDEPTPSLKSLQWCGASSVARYIGSERIEKVRARTDHGTGQRRLNW